MLAMLLILACTTDCPPCAEAPPPAPASPPPSELDLDAWQTEMLRPMAASLAAGVQPFGGQGFGMCQGKAGCETYLGNEPGELAPGDYIVRAELTVPKLGEGWRARFDLDCTVTSAAGRVKPRQHSREYDIGHTGPSRGYRLEPLWRVQSPRTDGAHSCTFTLTPIRPDGQEQAPLVGHYTTPQPPAK